MARHIERRRKQRPVYPAPELVVDEALDILEEAGMGGSIEIGVSDRKRRMRVPLADTPRARHVRAHETAHAKFSPADPMIPKGLPNLAMQRAEDMRMNYYCRAHGLDEAMDAPICDSPTGEIIHSLVTAPLRAGRLQPAVSAACATYKTGDYSLVMDAIGGVDFMLLDQITAFIPALWEYYSDKRNPTWDDALRNAWELVKFCEGPESYSDGRGTPEESSDGSSDDSGEPDGSEGSGEPTDSSSDGSDDGSGGGKPEDSPSGDTEGEPGSASKAPGGDSASSGGPSSETDDDDSTGDPSDSSTTDDSTGTPSEAEKPADDGPKKPVDLSDDIMDALVDCDMAKEEAEAAKDQFADDPVEGPIAEMMERFSGSPYYASREPVKVVERMTIDKRPLKQRLAASKLKGRTKIGQDYGRVPRYMGRYCADRAIFEGPGKRKGGGAILIDCSGSMHLTDRDIDQILTEAPAATVATYCGRGDGDEGYLWIIAANGKRIAAGDSTSAAMGGNVVDIPALRWLAKQRGDKYWICDGIVTGAGDRYGKNIAEACIDIVRRAHIMRVRTVDAFIERIGTM